MQLCIADCIKYSLTTYLQHCNADYIQPLPLPFKTYLWAEPLLHLLWQPLLKISMPADTCKGMQEQQRRQWIDAHSYQPYVCPQGVSFHSSMDIEIHTLGCALSAHFAVAKVFGTCSLSLYAVLLPCSCQPTL